MTTFVFIFLSSVVLLLIYFKKIPLNKDPVKSDRIYTQLKTPMLVGGLSLIVLSITYIW